MYKLLAALLSAASLAATAIATASGATRLREATGAPTVRVGVGDDFYSRAKLTVKKGTTVRWVWARGGTSDPHTVSAASGKWSSREMTSGSYSHRFSKPGRYTIFCRVHPDQMQIRVTVKR